MPFDTPKRCKVPGCRGKFAVNLTTFEKRRCVRDDYLCDPHAKVIIENHRKDQPGLGVEGFLEAAVPFDFELIACHKDRATHMIYLREVGGQRRFELGAGGFEASSLVRSLACKEPPRPQTYQVMSRLLSAFDGKLQHVLVYDYVKHEIENYYCAYLLVQRSGGAVNLDVRPSDAFNLAALTGAPIFIAESVLKNSPT